MDLTFNSKQTPISENELGDMPKDTREQFIDLLASVPFIKNMVSPKRLRAKDLPRDSQGRIIVDITNPHILEDMDYFRPAAIHFEKYGCYTKLRPNGNPNSEYMKWAKQEWDRIWNGMVRESDGEWIPGILYFYWNYSIILVNEEIDGTKKANRIEGFPRPWDSTYLWAHYINQAMYGGKHNNYKGGEHFGVIARRGCGKSLFIASILARAFICGENEVAREKVKSYVFAADKQFLTKDGTLNKFLDIINFCADNTQFPHLRLVERSNDMYWVMGYFDAKTRRPRGVLNEVMGVSIKDQPDKIRGKRGMYTFFEEFGYFKNFLQTFNTAKYNVEDGDISFGTMGCIGTGGTKGNDFSGALEMIYHPHGFKMYGLPNVFDPTKGNMGDCMFFIGAYLNRSECYDKDGNSDVIKAIIQVLNKRHLIRISTSDPSSMTQAKAEDPLTIQDCIMKTNTNIYPVADLNDRISELMLNPHAFDDVAVGKLNIVGGKVEFQATNDVPIRQYPIKDNKAEGALEIYKMPEINKATNEVFKYRYLLGADTYDNDVADSMSLGSVLVLDSFTDKIVAEYTGRPQYADDFYEICRRLCLFYNGKLNYEQNKKGLYAYFSRMHSLYLLTDAFSYLRDKDLSKGETFGNTSKGVTSTVPIKNYSRGLIREWLLKPAIRYVKVGDEEVEETYPQLMDIKNIALLQELSKYDLDANFDRHDALAMLMLYREDVYRLTSGDPKGGNKTPDEFDNDKFFKQYENAQHRHDKKKLNGALLL